MKHPTNTDYHMVDRNQLFPIQKVKPMVDLGVRFDSNLTLREHISEKIYKACSVLGIIKRNFTYMEKHTFILLYKSTVHPCVEFSNSVWCPLKM